MVNIDYTRDELLTPFSKKTLSDRYLIPGEVSPQDAFARAAKAFASSPEHAQRIYDYASKLWFMFSTPILSNGGTERGMPISCFLNYVPDSRGGLSDHYRENNFLSSMGGGVGGYWGHVRSKGAKTSKGSQSSGTIPFMQVVNASVMAFSQGKTRRGSYASYQDISHPEIFEFLEMRKPTGGDPDLKCLNLHHGVNITDAFMRKIEALANGTSKDDSWDLIDPNSKEVVATVSAKELWQKILTMRVETGEPYIHFVDRSNEFLPEYQKAKGLKVHQSNLCSEITLPTSADRTAVCCLSSVNLEKYNEWQYHPLFIADLIEFLDNVLQFFIDNGGPEVSRAVNSAIQERSLGLGAMGFHGFLQSKGIPFESAIAVSWNKRIFKKIKEEAYNASLHLAKSRGAAPDTRPVGSYWPVQGDAAYPRNTHLLAIAPNASSSIICGETSPSIEPSRANCYTHKTKSGSFFVKNRWLTKVLQDYGRDDQETWSRIIADGGSVQGLDFLTDDEKAVFKTALEIDQRWLIDHAGDRQEYICQAQSLNLFFPPNIDIPTLHHVHLRAWKKGLKSLYYLRSETLHRAETISAKVERVKLNDYETCLSCEG